MGRIVFSLIFAFFAQTISILANEYAQGDIIQQDGISYKVVVSYLVVNPKESPDTITGPDKFYSSGELMAIKVDDDLKDVVIPPAVGRFKVVGLTDSLFFEHRHNRIWLPNLNFVGNGCFARLKVESGTLVLHDIENFGEAVFDDLDADLLLEITKAPKWGKAFEKMQDSTYAPCKINGVFKLNSSKFSFVIPAISNNCYTARADNYKVWLDKAFDGDEEFQKNDLKDKNAHLNKRSYSTTPRSNKNGFNITATALNVKKLGYPWGRLTSDYFRESKYRVDNKKRKRKGPNTATYDDFIPVADATLKEGWYVKFVDVEGEKEIKYKLNGKMIKR